MLRRRVVAPAVGIVCLGVATSYADSRPPSKGQPTPAFFEHFDGGVSETPGARYVKSLSTKDQAALARDGLVVQDQLTASGAPMRLVAAVKFNRPVNEVYALLTRPSEHASFLPNVARSKTFGVRTDEAEQVDYEVAMVFRFKFRTQHWYYPEHRRIEWALDPTGEDGLLEQAGSWQLYELDAATTVAQYTTRMVINGAVFNLVRGIGERGGVVQSLLATKKHVEASKL
jgi:uncharacterized protein YndB with AHSA1/START domain